MLSCSAGKHASRAPTTATTSCSPAPASRSPGRWAAGRHTRQQHVEALLRYEDIERTLKLAAEDGATLDLPAMAIDDLGHQAGIADPAGAVTGIWQPGSFPGFIVIQSTAPRASSPSTSTTTTPRWPSIAKCSAGIRSRRRPTVITTPATWTPTTTDQSPGSATRWSRWRPQNRRTGRCSGKATTSMLRSRKSARLAARCSPRLPTTASGGSPEWPTLRGALLAVPAQGLAHGGRLGERSQRRNAPVVVPEAHDRQGGTGTRTEHRPQPAAHPRVSRAPEH